MALLRLDRGAVAAHSRQRAAGRLADPIAADRAGDELVEGEHVVVVAVVPFQAVEAGAAGGDAGNREHAAGGDEQRAARVAVAGVGAFTLVVPADVSRAAGVGRTGVGDHVAGLLDAVILEVAAGAAVAGDGRAGSQRDGGGLERCGRDAGDRTGQLEHRDVVVREAEVRVDVPLDDRHEADVLQVDAERLVRLGVLAVGPVAKAGAVGGGQEHVASDQRAGADERAALAARQEDAGGRELSGRGAVDDGARLVGGREIGGAARQANAGEQKTTEVHGLAA